MSGTKNKFLINVILNAIICNPDNFQMKGERQEDKRKKERRGGFSTGGLICFGADIGSLFYFHSKIWLLAVLIGIGLFRLQYGVLVFFNVHLGLSFLISAFSNANDQRSFQTFNARMFHLMFSFCITSSCRKSSGGQPYMVVAVNGWRD